MGEKSHKITGLSNKDVGDTVLSPLGGGVDSLDNGVGWVFQRGLL